MAVIHHRYMEDSKMRKLKITVVSLFVSILVTPLAVSPLIKLPNDITDEKRELSQFPTSFNNHFFDQIASWFNDHSPFRQWLIQKYSTLDNSTEDWFFNLLYSILYGNKSFPVGEEMFSWDNLKDDPYLDKGQPYYPAKQEGEVIFGRDDWLFYSGGGALNDYRGTNAIPVEEMKRIVEKIENVQSICSKKGLTYAMIILPNKEQVYADKMPTYTIKDRNKKLLRIEKYIEEKASLNFVYPLRDLIHSRLESKNSYYVQDTHWNTYGAMIGYQSLCQIIGVQTSPYSVLQVEKTGGGTAGMLGIQGTTYITNEVDYKPSTKISLKYYDEWTIDTTSDLDSERNCVIARDSFAGYWLPIIAKDFKKVSMTHFDKNHHTYLASSISKMRPGDVFVMEAVERQFDGLVDSCERIIEELIKLPNAE